MWSNFLNYLSVLAKWLAWCPWNGREIRVGEDPIMGLEDNYKLLASLINELHGKYIFYLI